MSRYKKEILIFFLNFLCVFGDECGNIKVSIGFSIGGEYSKPGQWPWLSSLFHQGKYECGGSIINRKHLLTAAHCPHPKGRESQKLASDYYVFLGRYKLNNTELDLNSIRVDVADIFIHPDWDPNKNNLRYDADIAIFLMASEIEYNDFIQPICLPAKNAKISDIYGTVVGYGLSEESRPHENRQKHVEIKSVSDTTCLFTEQKYVRFSSPRMFCAGEKGKNPCRGDSGSPFMVKQSRKWTVNGIVSTAAHSECHDNDFVLFTQVPKFLEWINEILSLNNVCTDYRTGKVGECVEISKCPAELERFQKFGKIPTICNRQTRFICCPTKTSQEPLRISAIKCREYASSITECPYKPTPLIFGGEDTVEKEFPHMTMLGYIQRDKDSEIIKYECTGSLISEQWILTVAQCRKHRGLTPSVAKIGNVKKSTDNMFAFTLKIVETIFHPGYNTRSKNHDIALFKLQFPVEFNDYVIPICLPSNDDQMIKKVIATGWGFTEIIGRNGTSDSLMKGKLEIFSTEECQKEYREVNGSVVICAGSRLGNADTCTGDSGAPLQIYNLDSDVTCMYTIIGMTSFGPQFCGLPGVPSVYTKVHFYLDWIESIVWPQ